jgi:hypothetical protein
MKQMIYTSTATESVNFDVINDLLTQCVQKNNEFSISGMMVFDGKQFLQCIEGNEAQINQLQENIFKDTRHQNIYLLGEEEVTERLFNKWNMGYLNNQKAIRQVFLEVSGSEEYAFKNLSYENAKSILSKLSYMI